MHTRSRRKPRQNTLLFEELEPRLLFSADAAEALTGMAVEQSVDEEPEVAAAEEPAADSVDQSTAADTPEPMAQPATQDQPGETADAEAAPQLLESEAPAEAAPADAEPAATGEPVLSADTGIDPAQPVAESTAQPATADTPDPVAQAVVDGDQAAAAQELAPTLVEPVETSESATLIDSTAAADEPSATTASIEPTAGLDQPTPASELVFIDGAVRDGQTLVDSLLAPREDGRSFEVVVLDPDRVGIDQVSTALAGYDNLQAIHFLSHGGDGELLLGSTRLDSTSLSLYTDDLAAWGEALDDRGDILLYGCDIAASADGRFLVDSLSQLTGADVAASTDASGHDSLGGDWLLEYQVGQVETPVVLSAVLQAEYVDLLDGVITEVPGLWLSSKTSATTTAATGLITYDDGQIVRFADPNLALGSGATSGTFAKVFNIDTFAADGNAGIFGLHYVSRTVTVGTVNPVTLQAGDVLLSTDTPETLGGVAVTTKNVVLFRPTTPGDYAAGTFSVVLANPGSTGAAIRDFALVETPMALGGTNLQAGDFLLALSGGAYDKDVSLFRPTAMTTSAGGTTGGTLSTLVDGDGSTGISFAAQIYGLELVQQARIVGNTLLDQGQLLITLNGNDVVGTNNLSVKPFDVFALTVSATGAKTSSASAAMLLRGLDVGLSAGGEEIDAVALAGAYTTPANTAPTLTLPGGPLIYPENAPATVIDASATLTDADSVDFAGGCLFVDLGQTGTTSDRLVVRNEGSAAGQIGVSGADIT